MSKTNLFEGSWFNSKKRRNEPPKPTRKSQPQPANQEDARVEGVFNLACDCKPTEKEHYHD